MARDDGPNIYRSFGRRYAERGHVVLAPDAIGFGERAEDFRRYGQRDGCNINFMRALLFGINLMALNIQDDRRGGWTSWPRCRRWTPDGWAAPGYRLAARARCTWARWTRGSGRQW